MLHRYTSLENTFYVKQVQSLEGLPEKDEIVSLLNEDEPTDGIIFFQITEDPCVIKLRLYNKDGSGAGFSGNGFACLSRYIYECYHARKYEEIEGIPYPPDIFILRGRLALFLESENTRVETITTRSRVRLRIEKYEKIHDKYHFSHTCCEVPYHLMNVGNEHAIFFDSLSEAELESHFDNKDQFPDSINVNLAKVLSLHKMELSVRERGCGFTRACSSGAIASGVCAHELGLVEMPLQIIQAGGTSEMDWMSDQGVYQLTLTPEYLGSREYETE